MHKMDLKVHKKLGKIALIKKKKINCLERMESKLLMLYYWSNILFKY
jgi:hypothetical protein